MSSLESKITADMTVTRGELAIVAKQVESMDDRLKALGEKIHGVLELLIARPPASLGEDGFLHQNCPAPMGWNQNAYEA